MRLLLFLIALSACVSTQATNLAGFDPTRPRTCWQVVKLYASPGSVPGPYVELAVLKASSSDPVAQDKLVRSMQEKAAEVGANGILLLAFGSEQSGPGLISSAFVAKPTGNGVAIWIPSDSANLGARCQQAADSAARADTVRSRTCPGIKNADGSCR